MPLCWYAATEESVAMTIETQLYIDRFLARKICHIFRNLVQNFRSENAELGRGRPAERGDLGIACGV